MFRQLSFLPFACLVACSVTDTPRRDPVMETETSAVGVVEASMSKGDAAAAEQPAPQDSAAAREQRELDAVWRSPEFRQQFINSYLADSASEPTLTAREVELMQEVAELMGDKRKDDALSRLQSRQSQDASAIIDFTIAQLLYEKEQFDEARAEYLKAVSKKDTFARAWNMLGMTRMRLSDWSGAGDAFARVLELGRPTALTYGMLGFCHGNAEDHIAAESAYRMASMLQPHNNDWRLGLARSFFKQRRFGEAQALCSAMIARNPDDASLWTLQANAYVGMKELGKAAENFELVDQLGASTFENLALLGDIYISEGLFDLAADAYRRAVAKQQQGDHTRVLVAAQQLAARSAYADAKTLLATIESHYGATLDTVAKKDILKLRARLAVATGEGDEEIAILKEITAIDPLDGDALILLGQYYARNGKPEEAILRFEQAAENPQFAADAKVRHAQLLASEGDYAKALPLLRAAQKIEPREHVQKFLEDVEKVAGRGK